MIKSNFNVIIMTAIATIAFVVVLTILDIINGSFDFWQTIAGGLVFFVLYLISIEIVMRLRKN